MNPSLAIIICPRSWLWSPGSCEWAAAFEAGAEAAQPPRTERPTRRTSTEASVFPMTTLRAGGAPGSRGSAVFGGGAELVAREDSGSDLGLFLRREARLAEAQGAARRGRKYDAGRLCFAGVDGV